MSTSDPRNDARTRRQLLERVRDSNPTSPPGDGPKVNECCIKLAQYRNWSLSRLLCRQLRQKGIKIRVAEGRVLQTIFVCINDREHAFRILTEFKRDHPDSSPQGFTRDYEFALICLLFTFVAALSVLLVSKEGHKYAPQICFSGVSMCVIVEYVRWIMRHKNSLQFRIIEIMALALLIAANFAIWKHFG